MHRTTWPAGSRSDRVQPRNVAHNVDVPISHSPAPSHNPSLEKCSHYGVPEGRGPLHVFRSMVCRDEVLFFVLRARTSSRLAFCKNCNVIASRFFLAQVTRGDFGATCSARNSIIFLLTSFCVDSIHSISCNKRPLQDSMKNGKGE